MIVGLVSGGGAGGPGGKVVENIHPYGQARSAGETSDANIRVDTWDQNTIEAPVTTEDWKIGENAPANVASKSCNIKPETPSNSKFGFHTRSASFALISAATGWMSKSTCLAKGESIYIPAMAPSG